MLFLFDTSLWFNFQVPNFLSNSYACWLRTIGEMLGRAVHGRFLDADDYHSESNKGKDYDHDFLIKIMADQ